MKRKAILFALTVSIALLTFPAIALGAYTHGDFGQNSKGCGDCHITHAGEAMKLLVSTSGGGTQTDVCYSCHDNTSASPYNVADGLIKGNDGVQRASFAGGFVKAADFQDTSGDLDASVVANGPVVEADSFMNSTTSVHSVELMNDSSAYQGQANKQIPGGSVTSVTGSLGFRCGSCHDPHAGGEYKVVPDAGKPYINPRLLRVDGLVANTSTVRAVYMTIDYTALTGTLLPTAYGNAANSKASGFDGWCGGCHDVFDTENAQAGINGHNAGGTKYRHLFGIDLNAAGNGAKLPDLNVLQQYGNDLAGIPLDKAGVNGGTGKDIRILTCISCHRAHGTSSQMDADLAYKRYQEYNGDGIDGTGTNVDHSSALLRMNNRDVCWKCHGAGKYNKSWN